MTLRTRFGWATTACWDMWAETSPWSSSTADPTPYFPACISITDMERKLRVHSRDRPHERDWASTEQSGTESLPLMCHRHTVGDAEEFRSFRGSLAFGNIAPLIS